MRRATKSRWLVPLLALLGAGLAAPEADAARPQNRGGGGLDGGGYAQFAPGVVGVGVPGLGFDRDYRMSWAGAFGVGGMFVAGPFKATLGVAIEHHVMLFDRFSFSDNRGQSLHFLAESRLGAGTNRVWGYGLVGFGPALTLLHGAEGGFAGATLGFGGVNLQLGGGIQGMVARRLFLGGEFDIDHGFYFDNARAYFDRSDFSYHTMTLKFLIGWYF